MELRGAPLVFANANIRLRARSGFSSFYFHSPVPLIDRKWFSCDKKSPQSLPKSHSVGQMTIEQGWGSYLRKVTKLQLLVQGGWGGWPTGNGKKLSSRQVQLGQVQLGQAQLGQAQLGQAQLGQATCLAVS